MSLKFSLNPTANFPAHPRTNIEFPLGFDDSCGLTTSVDLGERRSLRMVSQVAGVPILQWRPYGSMMIHVASNSNSLEFHAELCAIPHAFYGWRWAIFPWPELQGYLEVEPTAVSLPRLRCPRTFGLLALY